MAGRNRRVSLPLHRLHRSSAANCPHLSVRAMSPWAWPDAWRAFPARAEVRRPRQDVWLSRSSRTGRHSGHRGGHCRHASGMTCMFRKARRRADSRNGHTVRKPGRASSCPVPRVPTEGLRAVSCRSRQESATDLLPVVVLECLRISQPERGD